MSRFVLSVSSPSPHVAPHHFFTPLSGGHDPDLRSVAGSIAQSRALCSEAYPLIEMHPEDMAERDITAGDLIEVFNDNGATQAMAAKGISFKSKEYKL